MTVAAVLTYMVFNSSNYKKHSSVTKQLVGFVMSQALCQPHKHIYYLKVPKTGSSTFNSILNRMTMKYNLTSLRNTKELPHPNEVLKLIGETPESSNRRFDTKALHGRFDEYELAEIMQKDTIYIATVREPYQHFKSYFLFKHHGTKSMPVLQQQMEDMILTSSPSPKKNYFRTFKKYKYEYLENPIFRYFKYDYSSALFNQTFFKDRINHIAGIFQIVIADKYDESLLLLKRKLCWNIKDIIFIPHKNASYSGKNSKQPNEDVLKETHKNISKLDYYLYNHFLDIHNEEVAQSGLDFVEEFQEYQRAKAQASSFCWNIYTQLFKHFDRGSVNYLPVLSQTFTIEGSRFWDSFTVNGSDCVIMAMCGWHFRDMSVALTYPILCEKTFRTFTFDHTYCPTANQTNVFAYDNIYFPYKYMRKIIHCDLICTY